MIKNVLRTKVGSSVAVATVITMASGVGVASAHHGWFKMADEKKDHSTGYYTKDQCKDGGWKQFKDENGKPLFKNQGQCVAFFASGGKVNNGHHDRDDHGNNHHGDKNHHDNNNHNNHGNNSHQVSYGNHWWSGLAASFWNHGKH